ncbi:uncharacterized protein LOC101731247 [Xenopus tropicalis]|uniref:Uncharacterized protein LOC101731247 n=1 Tax=Xenopus tropicalis TaxID=8364 RepID=A0A8J0QWZ9_XENTR|nr:uncharacterized protein LOC101731247 [Xenopus tropicalis]
MLSRFASTAASRELTTEEMLRWILQGERKDAVAQLYQQLRRESDETEENQACTSEEVEGSITDSAPATRPAKKKRGAATGSKPVTRAATKLRKRAVSVAGRKGKAVQQPEQQGQQVQPERPEQTAHPVNWPSTSPPRLAMGGDVGAVRMRTQSVEPKLKGTGSSSLDCTAPSTSSQWPPQEGAGVLARGQAGASGPLQESNTLQELEQRIVVFILGHSFIYAAQRRALDRSYGINLGFNKEEVIIHWMGIRGARWSDLIPILSQMLSKHGAPNLVLIHLGGNDLGKFKAIELIRAIRKDLALAHFHLPGILFLWSEMVSRRVWTLTKEKKPLERCRKKVNFAIAKFMKSLNMLSYRHIDLEGGGDGLYGMDNVHLSKIGYDIFNMGLQNAIDMALVKWRGGLS